MDYYRNGAYQYSTPGIDKNPFGNTVKKTPAASTSATPGKLPWETTAPVTPGAGGTQGQTYYPVNPLGPYSGPLGTAPVPAPQAPAPTPSQPAPQTGGGNHFPFGLGGLSSRWGDGNSWLSDLLNRLRSGSQQQPAPTPTPSQPMPQPSPSPQFNMPDLMQRPRMGNRWGV